MIDFNRLIDFHLFRKSRPKGIGRYYPSEAGNCLRKTWYSYKTIKHKKITILLEVSDKMEITKPIDCKITYKRREGDKIRFSVNISDFSGGLLYVVPATYNMGTGECECNFLSQVKGLKNQSFKGRDRTCEHYPDGNCDIVTEEIKVADMKRKGFGMIG